MRNRIITATEANRSFSDILNKVHYQHQSFDIKRGKEIIARIVPAAPTTLSVAELNDFFKNLPSLDEEDIASFEQTLKEIRTVKPEKDQWD